MANFYIANMNSDVISGHDTFEEAYTLAKGMVSNPEWTRGLQILQTIHVFEVEAKIEKTMVEKSLADPAVMKIQPVTLDTDISKVVE